MKKENDLGFLESNKKLFIGIAGGLGLAFLGVALWTAFFKKATVTGTITDRSTGLPIEGVSVTLSGDDGSLDTTLTDAEGKYIFRESPTTSYSYQGYSYVYYYELKFEFTNYSPVTRGPLIFHPMSNTYNVAMEAI